MKRTVILISTSYPRWSGDHAGQFLGHMVEELRRVYTVRVIAPDYPKSRLHKQDSGTMRFRYFIPDFCQQLTYKNGIPDNLKRNPLLNIQIPFFLISLKRMIEKYAAPDSLLLTNWLLPSGWIGSLIARKRGIPHLTIAHGSDIYFLKKNPFRAHLLRTITSGCQSIVTVARYQKSELEGMMSRAVIAGQSVPVEVLPMGFHPLHRSGLDRISHDNDSVFKLLFMGRLIRMKGVHCLLEAVRNMPGIELHIAGDGPERQKLEDYARDHHISAKFHGWVDTAKKSHLLQSCHTAVFPSILTSTGQQEGVPVSLLEALGAGLPIIASRNGGITDIIEQGTNGILVTPGSIPALQQAVHLLHSDVEGRKRFSVEAEHTAERFDWNRIGHQYAQLIQKTERMFELGNRHERKCN
jgi:glycosyltransferase involved in cell wall biosynthesis